MDPKSVVTNAMKLAQTAIAQGGKPDSVKVKVKFPRSQRVKAVKKRAFSAYHVPEKGVTR